MDASKLKSFVEALWDDAVVPSLTEYIRIPNKSPAFDKDWAAHGYMDDAVKLMEGWARDGDADYITRLYRGRLRTFNQITVAQTEAAVHKYGQGQFPDLLEI